MFKLTEKVALVTGAGSGIGQAIAEVFAQQGAHVEVIDLKLEAAQVTVNQITAAGGSAYASACDVGDHDAVKALVDAIAQRRTKIDILVNNAGIAHIGTLLTTNESELDRLYQLGAIHAYRDGRDVVWACEPPRIGGSNA